MLAEGKITEIIVMADEFCKVFKDIAQRDKCFLGWFYGFKLHLICNDKGEILNFMITLGDVDDREPLKMKSFVEFIYGKLVGDKGYISQNLFNKLFIDGIQLITKLKSNMRGGLRSMYDRILLRKRAIIETINDKLKKHCSNRTLKTPFFYKFHCKSYWRNRCILLFSQETDA